MTPEINKLIEEKSILEAERELVELKIQSLEDSIRGSSSRLKYKRKSTIDVSDHCLIRYIEREYGLNINELKKEILSEQVLIGSQLSNHGKFMIKPGLCAIVANNVVVTTYEV